MDFSPPTLLLFQVVALQPGRHIGFSWTSQLLSAKSPLGALRCLCTSLLKQRVSSNPGVLKEEFRMSSPRHTILFSPKRKTLSVLHTSFWSSRRSSYQLPVFSRRITTAYCFLVPPKQFDFFFGFFTKEKPLQGLQLSWHPSVLTKRPFFPWQSFPAPFCL